MQHYKSLFLVAMMGGVVLCVAGMMTTFEQAARKKRSKVEEPKEELPSDLRIRMPVAGKRPEGQLEADLEVVRDTFNRDGRPEADRMEKARRHLNRAADFLKPTDWPVLKAEFERKPLHPGYRTMLIILAGACMSEDALPIISAHWKQYPAKVADALQRNGTSAAFDVAKKLYSSTKSEGEQLMLLRSMSPFPEVEVRAFLLTLLSGGGHDNVLKQAITLMRHHRHADVVAGLDSFVRGCGPGRLDLAKRALNSMTGLKLEAANVRVLEMYLDAGLDRGLRDAAGEALAFSRAPFLVDRVLEVLEEKPTADLPALISFLNRNAGSDHVAPLTELLEKLPPGELHDAVETLLARLAPRGSGG